MKKGFNILILIFGLIAFASCSKEKDLPSPEESSFQTNESSMSIPTMEGELQDTIVSGLYIDKKTSNSKKNNLSGSTNIVKAP